MEVQLEEEYDEKQKVMKEKRELESKLLSAEDKVGPASGTAPVPASRTAWSPERRPAPQVRGGDVETEKRLRKDLKRTKALLVDAQIMLDHIKNNAPSKREIAQLKNQVGPPGLVQHTWGPATVTLTLRLVPWSSWKSQSSPALLPSKLASPWRWSWRTCTFRWRTSPEPSRRSVAPLRFPGSRCRGNASPPQRLKRFR